MIPYNPIALEVYRTCRQFWIYDRLLGELLDGQNQYVRNYYGFGSALKNHKWISE